MVISKEASKTLRSVASIFANQKVLHTREFNTEKVVFAETPTESLVLLKILAITRAPEIGARFAEGIVQIASTPQRTRIRGAEAVVRTPTRACKVDVLPPAQGKLQQGISFVCLLESHRRAQIVFELPVPINQEGIEISHRLIS